MSLPADTLIAPTGRIFQGKIASDSGRSAVLVAGMDGSAAPQVVIYDDAGAIKMLSLPGLTNGEISAATVELLGDKLFVLVIGSGTPVVYEYVLGTTLTLVRKISFGDVACRNPVLCKHPDGSVTAWYVRQESDVTVVFAVRSPDGVWAASTIALWPSSSLKPHDIAVAVHPADGTIRVYVSGDGSHRIGQAIFSSAGKLISPVLADGNSVAKARDFISDPVVNGKHLNGDLSPCGEFPKPVLVPDATRRQLVIAYTNINGIFVQKTPTSGAWKARVTIAGIPADGQPVLIGQTVETIWQNDYGVALQVKPDKIQLTFPPSDVGTGVETKFSTTWQNGILSPATKILDTARNVLCYRPDVAHFLYIAPDKSVRLANLEPAVTESQDTFGDLMRRTALAAGNPSTTNQDVAKLLAETQKVMLSEFGTKV